MPNGKSTLPGWHDNRFGDNFGTHKSPIAFTFLVCVGSRSVPARLLLGQASGLDVATGLALSVLPEMRPPGTLTMPTVPIVQSDHLVVTRGEVSWLSTAYRLDLASSSVRRVGAGHRAPKIREIGGQRRAELQSLPGDGVSQAVA